MTKTKGQGSGIKAYWARMTKEERHKEMVRRARKRKLNAARKTNTNRPKRRTNKNAKQQHSEENIAFVVGRAVQFVQDLAEGYSLPRQVLAVRVAELLQANQGR